MSFIEYLAHYTEMPGIIYMVGVSMFILLVIHLVMFLLVKATGGDYALSMEKYYEMIISSTSMLFFIGVYFLIEHRYFNVSESFYEIWNKYDDFLLLLALFISIFFINFVDTFLIPLKLLYREEKATLRMLAMIYMLIIFAYIKFIYKNDNYDSIIVYFIIMIIGRFVYFDASFADFLLNLKNQFLEAPTLLLAISSTAVIAWYGFGTDYLLKTNGVVLSLWIAHLFFIFEIVIIHGILRRIRRKAVKKKGQQEEYNYDYDNLEDITDYYEN